MTRRKFGVEIECGFEPYVDPDEVEGWLYDAGMSGWSVGEDGTMIEARTPILCGPPGLAVLKKAMGLFLSHGGYVTADDGMHVHHDAPEFVHDMDAIIRLVKSWFANRQAICQMVDPMRVQYDSCPAWTPESIRHLENQRTFEGYSRNDLNITSLRRGTIEIRLHEGTLNYEEAESWILFGQQFIEQVLAGHEPKNNAGSTQLLLEHIRLAEQNNRFLLAKAASNTGQSRMEPGERDRDDSW